MKKVILYVGIFVLIVITICNFKKDEIKYLYHKITIDYKYEYNTKSNDYYLKDDFQYFDNYTNTEYHSSKEILNSIYYLVNSGSTTLTRYCNIDYKDCINDLEVIISNQELLGLINNYVHPYNSIKEINFKIIDNQVIEFGTVKNYTNKEIDSINKVVDKIINENIKSNMTTEEKIKVIHDYIINNTKYDKEFDTNNNIYKSNTAYGVLINNYGICSGYSDAMAIFLNKLNIANYKVDNLEHVWNVVYLNNNYLHLDITWDDPITSDNSDILLDKYFLITTNELKEINDEIHFYNINYYPELK